MQLYRGEAGQLHWRLCYRPSKCLHWYLDLSLKADHKYRLSFSFWSWPPSEGLSTLHTLFLEHGAKACSRLRHGSSARNHSGNHSSFLLNSFLIMVSRTKTRDLKKARSGEQETVVAAKWMISCSVRAAFGTLQTHCRKERSGRRAGRSWSLTWKFKKLLDLGFAATNDWEVYSADNLRALTWRGRSHHRSYLYLNCTHSGENLFSIWYYDDAFDSRR